MEKWGKGYKIYSAKGRTMNTKQGRLCIELLALIGILCGMLTAYQEALCIILFNSCSSPVKKAQFSQGNLKLRFFQEVPFISQRIRGRAGYSYPGLYLLVALSLVLAGAYGWRSSHTWQGPAISRGARGHEASPWERHKELGYSQVSWGLRWALSCVLVQEASCSLGMDCGRGQPS